MTKVRAYSPGDIKSHYDAHIHIEVEASARTERSCQSSQTWRRRRVHIEVSMNLSPPFSKELCASLPKFNRSVSMLCWAYNEEELIEGFLRRAYALMEATVEDFEILIIDDCSKDRTNAIIRELIQELPRIRLLTNDKNRNVGYSLKRAVSNASNEFLFWQTIDWSYEISLLRIYLEMLKEYDTVAGVRRGPSAFKLLSLSRLLSWKHLTSRSDSPKKAMVSITNYLLIRLLFRIPLSDFQNVVFYRTSFVQSLTMEADSAFINPELLIKSYWQGASIAEVPIAFLPRQAGEAKGTKFNAIKKAVSDIFSLWFKWVVLGKRGRVSKGALARLKMEDWEPRQRMLLAQ